MKKVICAAAAFMMVAGVATVSSAAVKLSGDARARVYIQDSGLAGSDTTDTWSSRVRVKVQATTESGAFAKARIRMADAKWDGTKNTRNKAEATNIYVDYASAGIKMGKVTIEGGLQNDSFSNFFEMDNRADRLKVKIDLENGFIAGTFDKKIEVTGNAADDAADNDENIYGISYLGKLSDAFTLQTRVIYVDDSTVADLSGLKGSINGDMNLGGSSLFAELSYKSGDTVSATADDQIGGYVQWSGSFGDLSPKVTLGFTQDGYEADDDFGFIMIGGASAITVIDQIGAGGDTIFAGIGSDYAASETLTLGAKVAYMDVDTLSGTGENPFEVSGYAKYKVGAGASVSAVVGFLDPDTADDSALGLAVTMGVKF